MKTKTATLMALTVILATALVFPNIGPVDAQEMAKFTKTAMKADNSEKLSPKAYGDKTKHSECSEEPCFESSDKTHGLKDQQVKDMKKSSESNKAQEFMKKFYRI